MYSNVDRLEFKVDGINKHTVASAYSNLDRLEFKASIYASITMTTHHYNLDRLEPPQPTKLKYGESSQTPQREFTSESDHHVMNLFYQEKNLKVNTHTMTPTNQGVFL